MTKELEALDRLYDNLKCNDYYFRGDASEDCNLIEKALKAFDIIKEKRVDVFYFMSCETLEEYNYECCEDIYGFCEDGIKRGILTQEEYDLLREVLS